MKNSQVLSVSLFYGLLALILNNINPQLLKTEKNRRERDSIFEEEHSMDKQDLNIAPTEMKSTVLKNGLNERLKSIFFCIKIFFSLLACFPIFVLIGECRNLLGFTVMSFQYIGIICGFLYLGYLAINGAGYYFKTKKLLTIVKISDLVFFLSAVVISFLPLLKSFSYFYDFNFYLSILWPLRPVFLFGLLTLILNNLNGGIWRVKTLMRKKANIIIFLSKIFLSIFVFGSFTELTIMSIESEGLGVLFPTVISFVIVILLSNSYALLNGIFFISSRRICKKIVYTLDLFFLAFAIIRGSIFAFNSLSDFPMKPELGRGEFILYCSLLFTMFFYGVLALLLNNITLGDLRKKKDIKVSP